MAPSNPVQTKAPEINYIRSYEDKDELYYEDYCRGLGDPDYYGYPGQSEEADNGNGTIDNSVPF